jgi:hypothetical protein
VHDGPERRHEVRPAPAERDGYIRRLDPDYIALLGDVDDVRERLQQLEESNQRQERYLVGGWAKDGVNYVRGIREQLGDLERSFANATSTVTAAVVAQMAVREARTAQRFTWLARGAWGILIVLLGVLAELAAKGRV